MNSKTFRRYWLILGLMLLSVLFGRAQNITQTIRGVVKDVHNHQPIIGATVVLAESDPIQGAVTDLDGAFRIENVQVGRHTLLISFVGYEQSVLPEILVGSGKEVVLEIPLTESLFELDELVIRADENLKGVPKNDMVSVSARSFSVEETSRYAATFDDPARAALSFPGVRGGGDDVMNEIVIRGNSPRGMLWRIEGVEVPNPNHFSETGGSSGGISMLSNNVLSNSDFYTGAFPADYGNATSGVFDIHLRNGNNEKREYAFEAGLIGIQAAAEGPLSAKNGSSYLVNYRYSTLALLDDIGVPIDGAIRFQDLSFKLQLPSERIGTFTLWGLGGISGQTIAADTTQEEYYNENFKQYIGTIGLKHLLYFDPNTFLESYAALSGNLHDYSLDTMKVRQDIMEDFQNDVLRVGTTINRKFNARHTARLGVIFSGLGYNYNSEYYDRDEQRVINDVNDMGSTSSLQAFAAWQYRISERMTMNSGIHSTRLNLNGNYTIEPRLGMRWRLTPTKTISAGFGVHSRMETPVIYLAQTEDTNGNYYQANRDLDLTKAMHYVIGYEHQPISDLRLKVEAYYQDLYDVLIVDENHIEEPWMEVFSALNTTAGYTNIPLSNKGTGENYGIELSLEKFFTRRYYFLATTSLFESKYTPANGETYNTRFNGNFIVNAIGGKEFPVGRAGKNLINLNGRFMWAGSNRYTPVDLQSSIQDGRTVRYWDQSFESRLPNYLRLDLGVSYRKNRPSHSSIIAFNIQNVTGRENAGGVYYSDSSQSIRTWEQLGILPNLSYRIEF